MVKHFDPSCPKCSKKFHVHHEDLRYAGVKLRKREIGDGSFLVLSDGRVAHEERFRPDHSYRDPIALPAVRAPGESASCLARLAVLAAALS